MKKRTIIFYGDSNTYGYDPAGYTSNRYPEEKCWTQILRRAVQDTWVIEAQGLNGRKIPEPYYEAGRLEKMLAKLAPGDVLAVMLGTNDILLTMEPDAEEAIRKMERFLTFLQRKVSLAGMLLIAPPYIGNENLTDPLYHRYYEESRKMNEGFGRLAASFGTMFADAASWGIDLSFDLVHFSEEGHRTFAGCMEEVLSRLSFSGQPACG